MNVLYLLCLTDYSREALKREESKKTSPGRSKPLHAGKTYTKTNEKTGESRKRTMHGFKTLPIVNIGTDVNKGETENSVKGWSQPLYALKTYTKTAEKTHETRKRIFTCSKPLPIVKTGTMSPEETPGESPLSAVRIPDFPSNCRYNCEVSESPIVLRVERA